MGKTSVADSYEIDAFNNNPANLIRQKTGNNGIVYFNVVSNVHYNVNSKYFSLDFYNKYFTKNNESAPVVITEKDKAEIINKAGNEPVYFYADGKDLSLIYNNKNAGSFGLSVDERISGNFILSRDFLQLGLYGNESGRTYDLSGVDYGGAWVRQINFTYANKINFKKNKFFSDMSYGLSVKPQLGMYYSEINKNNLSLTTNSQSEITGTGSVEFLYSSNAEDNGLEYTFAPAGFGFGFDLGINATIADISKNGRLNFGLSINDIGYINWTKNTNKYVYNGSFVITDITNKEQIDSLKEVINSSKVPVSSFTTSLPSNIRLGFSYKIFPSKNKSEKSADILETATFTVEYIQGLTDNFGSSTKPLFGLGGEYNISELFSARLGLTNGVNEKLIFSLGLGIDTGPVIIDLATYNINGILSSKSASNISGAAGIKFKIN
jgi:hypothetical protein